MLVKTSELTGAALDWAVAKCEGIEVEYINDGITKCLLQLSPFTARHSPSTDWAQGGPIIEREGISVELDEGDGENAWIANMGNPYQNGETPLIAAMRCYVVSKLGDTVDIPDEIA